MLPRQYILKQNSPMGMNFLSKTPSTPSLSTNNPLSSTPSVSSNSSLSFNSSFASNPPLTSFSSNPSSSPFLFQNQIKNPIKKPETVPINQNLNSPSILNDTTNSHTLPKKILSKNLIFPNNRLSLIHPKVANSSHVTRDRHSMGGEKIKKEIYKNIFLEEKKQKKIDEKKETVWFSVLEAVKKKFCDIKKYPDNFIIFYGEEKSGKKSLMKSLGFPSCQGSGPLLKYSFMEDWKVGKTKNHIWSVTSDLTPETTIWQLERALKLENLEKSIVMVTVSLENQKNIISKLEILLHFLEKHLKNLDQIHGLSHKKFLNLYEIIHQNEENPHPSSECHCSTPPPNKYLGLPIVIVVTKCDDQPENKFYLERNTYLSLLLRRFVLRHEAALIFTSTKTGINCGSLGNLISNLTLATNFEIIPELISPQMLLIPHGHDDPKEVEDLFQQFIDSQKSQTYGLNFEQELHSKLFGEIPNDGLSFYPAKESHGVDLSINPLPPVSTTVTMATGTSMVSLNVLESQEDEVFLLHLQELMSQPLVREAKVRFNTQEIRDVSFDSPSPVRKIITPAKQPTTPLRSVDPDTSGTLAIFFHQLLSSPKPSQFNKILKEDPLFTSMSPEGYSRRSTISNYPI